MRTKELFTLKRFHIDFMSHKAAIRLTHTKTSQRKGADELVIVESVAALKLLQYMCKLREPGQTILSRSPYQARKMFKDILTSFGLSTESFNYYSLRRGGATAYFFKAGSYANAV